MFLQTAIPCNIPICGKPPADMSLRPGASFMAAGNFKACQNDPFLILYLYDLSCMDGPPAQGFKPRTGMGHRIWDPCQQMELQPKKLEHYVQDVRTEVTVTAYEG